MKTILVIIAMLVSVVTQAQNGFMLTLTNSVNDNHTHNEMSIQEDKRKGWQLAFPPGQSEMGTVQGGSYSRSSSPTHYKEVRTDESTIHSPQFNYLTGKREIQTTKSLNHSFTEQKYRATLLAPDGYPYPEPIKRYPSVEEKTPEKVPSTDTPSEEDIQARVAREVERQLAERAQSMPQYQQSSQPVRNGPVMMPGTVPLPKWRENTNQVESVLNRPAMMPRTMPLPKWR